MTMNCESPISTEGSPGGISTLTCTLIGLSTPEQRESESQSQSTTNGTKGTSAQEVRDLFTFHALPLSGMNISGDKSWRGGRKNSGGDNGYSIDGGKAQIGPFLCLAHSEWVIYLPCCDDTRTHEGSVIDLFTN